MHFRGFTEHQPDNRRYARTLTNLNVGEPRTVRMIYFLPNDWQYRADVVQQMKDTIRTVQNFYAEQMHAHGYGEGTFRFETDSKGEPVAHRVDGKHPFSYYDNTLGSEVFSELGKSYDFNANIYFIVLGTDALRQAGGAPAGGVGYRDAKNGGMFLVPNEFSWSTVAHELGHTFGLNHDVRDDAYIMMPYDSGRYQLSPCAAEFLSVHPYFNSAIPTEEEQPPTIEHIRPTGYPSGSTSVPVRVRVSDSDGLHQVLLHTSEGLQLCRKLTGEKDAIVEFYPRAVAHGVRIEVVDTDGNVSETYYILAESSPHHLASLDGHTDLVKSVSFSPDGTLASGSWDKTVKLWDVATRQNITTFEKHVNIVGSVAFSPDGATLSSGSWQDIHLWDVATTASIAALRSGHWVSSISFSPDGKTLASGEQDGTLRLWDIATRQLIATLTHEAPVFSVSFSPDGETLASGGEDGTVKLWDVRTRQNIATLTHEHVILFVSFSPDGQTLAFGGWGDAIQIKLWNVATRQIIATLTHGATVSSVSFSPDGQTVAFGGWDGRIKLWDMTTKISVATFPHTSPIYSVSFSPDGRTLASGTSTGTVELWDTSGLIQLRTEALTEADIPDPNLRSAIVTALGVPPGVPIVRGNMTDLTLLDVGEAGIRNLAGLEHATNLKSLALVNNNISDLSTLAGLTKLTSLSLEANNISDLSTLAGLTKLTSLSLGANNISDLSALAGLTELTSLSLGGNNISDLSTLAGLTELTSLYLHGNNISDLSALAGLTELTSLSLGGNNISDLSTLAGMTELTYLNLDRNKISNLSPLVANTGLGEGDLVSVKGNPLSFESDKTHIPALQSRGVTVEFDNVAVEVVEPVNIVDDALRVAIKATLGKTRGILLPRGIWQN